MASKKIQNTCSQTQPSVNTLKRSNQEDHADTPVKVNRFEIEISTNNSWELFSGLKEYIQRYMGYHVADE